jgi:hypothetical protein
MRYPIYWSIFACLLLITMIGVSQSEDKTSIVNMMITADVPISPTDEQAKEAEANLLAIFDEIDRRNLLATVFATDDLVSTNARLRLTAIGINPKFELAMSGTHLDEKISSESYDLQRTALIKSRQSVETCQVCGKNEITIRGFLPQSFDQNQDTYKILDELGIEYNAGFQAGILYAKGHENDVWPYQVEGHKFYAVPVSTYTLSDKRLVLQDSYFNDSGLGASQWYDALTGKLDEIQGKDEPLVVSLTTSTSGSGDYLDAFKRFMDYAVSKKASFVTTKQLVDMTKANVRDISDLPASANVSAGCPTCDQSNNSIKITLSMNNTTQVVAP